MPAQLPLSWLESVSGKLVHAKVDQPINSPEGGLIRAGAIDCASWDSTDTADEGYGWLVIEWDVAGADGANVETTYHGADWTRCVEFL